MFIEVTDLEYKKKHLLNISSIVDIVDNNAEGFYPHTLIEYEGKFLPVKESYLHVKKSIDEVLKQLNKGK